MKTLWKARIVGVSVLLVALLAGSNGATVVIAQDLANPDPGTQEPYVSEPVTPGVSPPVRQLPIIRPQAPGGPGHEVNPRRQGRVIPSGADSATNRIDPLLQAAAPASLQRTPVPLLNFDGISNIDFVNPPDPVGDVGPDHYVQMVNSNFAIYDKQGTRLTGPTAINQLWAGEGGLCEANNDGDPIVLYDAQADRWMLSQFAIQAPNFALCIAISQTPDPTGAYYLYEFPTPVFPDYPKYGIWPDAYYMAANEDPPNVGVYAFERIRMLAGLPAAFQRFQVQRNFMLPSDLDGPTSPPLGAPNYFYTFMDDVFWPTNYGIGAGLPDRLEIWAYKVDFFNAANSSFTLVASLPITSFEYTVCGFFVLDCIPQPGPGQNLDSISEWPMWRLQYRNFDNHEALVGNFTVDVGNDRAGVRWFELRKRGSANWTLHQEGTHAPDATNHHWVGSAAMDRAGNIALGYSVSSSSLNPSIRYATRLADDPPGTLGNEVTLIAGGGVQADGFNRWGDYSSMNVDPADECTFWYTNIYYATTSNLEWQTRIGAFRIPSCGITLDLTKTASDITPEAGQTLTYTIALTNSGTIDATDALITDTLPAELTFVGPITLDPPGAGTPGSSLPNLATDVTLEAGKTITLTFPVSVERGLPGGAAITNTAVVTTPQLLAPVTGTEVVTIASNPALTVTKTADMRTARVGENITYTYAITNSGNVTLTSVNAIDNRLGPATPGAPTLAPGETISGTLTYRVRGSDLPGPLTNTVTVSGNPPVGTPVTARASASVAIRSSPIYLPLISR